MVEIDDEDEFLLNYSNLVQLIERKAEELGLDLILDFSFILCSGDEHQMEVTYGCDNNDEYFKITAAFQENKWVLLSCQKPSSCQ